MNPLNWRRWLRSFSLLPVRSRSLKKKQSPRSRIALEELEARLAPATFIWDGGGGNNLWSTAANWSGDVAPSPLGADDLVFPSGPTRLTTQNNFSGAIINSIAFSGSGYSLSGNSLTLGTPAAGSGFLIANLGATNNVITLDIQLGGAAGNRQFFTVGTLGANLTLSGRLLGTTGVELSKDGPGTLILTNNNSGFTGPISIATGILRITDALALGNTTALTTVLTNAQLQTSNVASPILETLILNGPGVANDGALLNVAGTSTWTGAVVLDSNSTLGAVSGSTFSISGVISDLGAGHNLIKEGIGQVVFTTANTYRGLTTINNGTLTIQHKDALGAGGSSQNGTIVNQNLIGVGTLQIDNDPSFASDPNRTNFTVFNEQVTLNGVGVSNAGALLNNRGNNTWAGSVVLGSPVPNGSNVNIGVTAAGSLIVSGVVGDRPFPDAPLNLTKVGAGKLIFNNANTYLGSTTIQAGILNIQDSQGLGPTPTSGSTSIATGTALEIEVDSGNDVHGRDLAFDSVTGYFGNGPKLGLRITENLTINGTGIANTGGLRSLSGINTWAGAIFLGGDAGIGVEPDPTPSNTNAYFTNDYSLTVLATVTGGGVFHKEGTGHLILPDAKTYIARTRIEEGWITIRNNQSLGGLVAGGDTAQPNTTVLSGAALHLKPLVPGTNLNVVENLVLAGTGITHPFPLISQKGALLSLGGDNIVGGPLTNRASDIEVIGSVGIGVEDVDPAYGPGELTITSSITEAAPVPITLDSSASGGDAEDSQIIDTGSTSGRITVNYDMFFVPDQLKIYYPPRGQPGSTLLHDTGLVSDIGTVVVNYGPGTSTFIEIVMNEGGSMQGGTVWDYTATILPSTGNARGGITKLGSRRLNLQGDGVYTGAVNINEGVLRAQNDTALGLHSTGTVTGSQSYTTTTTNVGAGIAEVQSFVVGNPVGLFTLTFNGQTTTPLNSLTATAAQVQAALNALPSIGGAGASVFVTRLGLVYTVTFGGAFVGLNLAELTAAGTGGVTVAVSTLVNGDGAALELESTNPLFNGGASSGLNIWYERLVLSGTGNGLFSASPLTILSNDHMWRGPVTLATNAVLQIPLNSRLNVFGTIDDVANPSPSGSNFTLVGGGQLALAGSNTFRGTAFVNQGVLLLENSLALGGNGLTEQQAVVLSGNTNGAFALNFNGRSTVALDFAATAAQVQAALENVPTIGAGNVTVSRTGNVLTVSFGGKLLGFDQPQMTAVGALGTTVVVGTIRNGAGGTAVANGSAVQLQGSLTIAGEPLILAGQGAATASHLPERWFLEGPAPTNNGQTGRNQAVTGRVTGIVVDPSDPDVIYISTAGGGAWKTKNGGRTWEPLFDIRNGISEVQTLTITGTTGTFTLTFNNETTAALPVNATAIQVETALNALASIGRVDGSVSVAKAGNVYTITFGGLLGQKDVPTITAAASAGITVVVNTSVPGVALDVPIFVGAIAMAPSNPRVLYIGTGEANNSTDTFYGTGIYKSVDSGRTWTLLTDPVLGNPLFGKAVSKIVVSGNPDVIYAAVGDADTFGGRVINGTAGGPGVWRYSGTNYSNLTAITSTTRDSVMSMQMPPPAFANPPRTPGPDDNYLISFPQSNATWSDLALIGNTLYAALGTSTGGSANGVYRTSNPDSPMPNWFVGDPSAGMSPDNRSMNQFPFGNANGTIKISASGTSIFAAVTSPGGSLRNVYESSDGGRNWAPAGTAAPPNYMSIHGNYASAILATSSSTVYVGGFESSSATHVQQFLQTTNGGTAWTDLSVDASGDSPHTAIHALASDSQGRILVGGDGGVWRLETTNDWTNLNGDLAISQINGIAAHPTDLTTTYAGIQSNGLARFSNNLNWTYLDNNTNPRLSTGGQVRVDPRNPNNVYHIEHQFGTISNLRRSTDAGTTWATVLNFLGTPLVLDSINTSRLLAESFDLEESLDRGTTWTGLNSPLGNLTDIGIAGFQGTFVADLSFPLVTDRGANTYDPDTIYVTDGDFVFVTKNHGTTWSNRTTLGSFGGIADLEVDPRNRDTVYAVRNVFGGGKVFVTDDAGLSWSDITNNLPNVPTWKIVLDIRNNNLYVGNDQGVWELPRGSSTWRRVGAGLPNVQVRDLELNVSNNTLLAGTYGRGVYRLILTDGKANAGALRGVSGSSVWTGPVTLAADTAVGAEGTQVIQDAISAAQLTIVGTISGDFSLAKIGGGDVVLAGSNTYTGLTTVQEGVLVVRNPNALGSAVLGTLVLSGTALEMQSSINAEPLQLDGDGIAFNGHNQGALRNVSNFNTYSGPITLATNSTIGVDSGSMLTITGVITDGLGSFNLTKELTGTLVLNAANTYDGSTAVNQGVLTVMHAQALGGTTNGTHVLDGASIQLQGGVTVVGEVLRLSGTGLFNTGVLRNGGGNNTWQGPVILTVLPGFSPATFPGTMINLGVTNASEILTIDGPISEVGGSFGFLKVGAGKLVLKQANSFTGVVGVSAGILNLQHGQALGTPGSLPTNGTVVALGAALELESAAGIVVAGETLTLNGNGIAPANAGALRNLLGSNTWTGGVILQTPTAIGANFLSQLTISGVVSGPAGIDLRKVGAGTVILSANNNYAGLSILDAGTLQVDGTIGNVRLNGGTLGGSGTVGTITANAVGGTVNPGFGNGILNSGNVIWNSASQFFINLSNTTPGTGHDQLRVTGTINLGGASIAGLVGSTVVTGDMFTVITATGGVSGTFAGGNRVFIGGRKFTVTYNANSVVLTQERADTTLSLRTSFSPSVFGQPVTFTATVTPEAGTGPVSPTTTVTFTVDGVATVVPVTGNVATLTLSMLSIGSHTISAAFNGDSAFRPSNAGPIIQNVNKANSTTTVASSANPSVSGQPVTLTATVRGAAPSVGIPTGTVTFIVDTLALPVVNLDVNGQASTVITANVGPHSVVAVYNGSGNYNGSTSTTLIQTVNKANTTTTLASTNTNALFGQAVITATVDPVAPGMGTPAGTVTFTINNGSTIRNVVAPLVGNMATLTPLDAGVYTITAAYSGNPNFNISSSTTLNQTIRRLATTTTLATTNPNALFGQAVITATVAPAAPGTVTFILNNGTSVSSVTVDVVNGVATLAPHLTPGVYTLTATYNGSTNFDTSTSAPLGQTVLKANSTTTLFTTFPVAPFGGTVVRAVVAPVAPAGGVPTGGVVFTVNDGTRILGVLNPLVNGVAVLGSPLVPGTYTITARYEGNENFNTSTSDPLVQTIIKASTTTTISAAPSPSFLGQAVTFTANVTPQAPATGVPGGTVNFIVDGVPQASSTDLVNGRATLVLNNLGLGAHTIGATYSGNGNFNSSVATGFAHTVLFSPLAFIQSPNAVPTGNTFPVNVEFRDGFGNRVTTFNGPVSLAVNSGPAGGLLGGTTTVNAVSGVASFTTLTLNKFGFYTLRASLPGTSFQSIVSNPITGQANRLAVSVLPVRPKVKTNFTLSVQAVDLLGGIDTNLNGPVTVRLLSGPRNAKLVGPLTGNLVQGSVQLGGLRVSLSGTYRLEVRIGSIVGVAEFTTQGRRL